MQTRAVAKYVRMSPRKVRLVTNLIRGKDLEEARQILDYCPKAAARVVAKVLASAAANAENNNRIPPERLYVLNAFVDEGPTLKRFRPRALGRATRINKRTSHITVILEEREEETAKKRSPLRRISRRPAARKLAGPRKEKEKKEEKVPEEESAEKEEVKETETPEAADLGKTEVAGEIEESAAPEDLREDSADEQAEESDNDTEEGEAEAKEVSDESPESSGEEEEGDIGETGSED